MFNTVLHLIFHLHFLKFSEKKAKNEREEKESTYLPMSTYNAILQQVGLAHGTHHTSCLINNTVSLVATNIA